MQPENVADILKKPISQEMLNRDLARLAYVAKDGTPRVVRIVVKPKWAKLIDFDEILPTPVDELVRRREERQQA